MIDISSLDWTKNNGLIPAIVQNSKTLAVLMLGYVSEESLRKTYEIGKVTFFSRSQNKLWTKGETSGTFLTLVDAKIDCDKDTVLILADPAGPTCHTGQQTCFGNENSAGLNWLYELQDVIKQRRTNIAGKSYVKFLIDKGVNQIAQKVGEEAVETALAAATDQDNFLDESADLLFHLMVLLEAKGASLDDVVQVLQDRRKR